ncbi:interleukin-2 [Hipposideros larvatus]
MYKMHFLSCIALTLALVADGAPISSSRKETQHQLDGLLTDLQKLLKGVNNYKDPERFMMLTFKFNMPKKVTELQHLQCLAEELRPLEDALLLVHSKNFPFSEIKDSMNNINVTVQVLKGPETRVPSECDDETANIVEFLNQWITFCQNIFSTLT